MSTVIDNDLMSDLGLNRPAAKKPDDELGQQDFLKLMTTQLKNQDPFAPMENGEFLAQIAQFASVSSIQELQNSFSTLSEALYSGQSLQAASLVGRQVLVAGDTGRWSGGEDVRGAVELQDNVADVKMDVFDASGQLVRSMDLGPQERGMAYFRWDGLTEAGMIASPGRYAVRATTTIDGQEQALKTYMVSGVESVTLSGVGEPVTLSTTDGKSVTVKDVKSIL